MRTVMRLPLLAMGWILALEGAAGRALTRRRDERGLSQSTETALLVAGAVLVASIIFVAVQALVKSKMGIAADAATGIGGS